MDNHADSRAADANGDVNPAQAAILCRGRGFGSSTSADAPACRNALDPFDHFWLSDPSNIRVRDWGFMERFCDVMTANLT